MTEHDHPLLGRLRMFGKMVDFSATPSSLDRPPPLVGQHSREILREVGFRDGDVDALIDAGSVYQADDTTPNASPSDPGHPLTPVTL